MVSANSPAPYWLVCSFVVAVMFSQIQSDLADADFRWRIYPQVFDGRRNQSVSRYAPDTNSPDNQISVYFSIPQRIFVLDLRLNHDFISPSVVFFHQWNGSLVKSNFSPERDGDCHFSGNLRSKPRSLVILSLCNDFSGVIYNSNETIYLTSGGDGYHYLHYDTQAINHGRKCGYTRDARDPLWNSTKSHRIRRDIRPPFGAGARSRYVEMAMVLDHGVYTNYGHNVEASHRRAIQVANIVNHLFGQLNVFVLLVGVQVWNEKNMIEVSDDGGKTLDAFLLYRRHSLNLQIPNDNAQLLTGVKFKEGVLGKALKGPICTDMYSGGVNMDHHETVALVASTVAHELGHNFGMSHDDDDNCKCASEKCIMASSSGSFVPRLWSSCSVEQMALAFEQGMDYCLRNIPDKVFGSPQCGNGLVDPGEECDCGLTTFCNTTCCNPATCKLTANATCANGLCCDLDICQPFRAGYQCRPAHAECDLPEYCDGHSPLCPRDFTKVNGAPCNGLKSYCYDGRCSSRDGQCQLLWGPTGRTASPRCFNLNTKGSRGSNCGYIGSQNTFVKCAKSDASCGTLYCDHLSEKLHFGMDSSANITSTQLRYDSNVILCKSVRIDLGRSERDPGLVPNGVSCGDNMMCVDQKCVSVTSVVEAKCSTDCGGADHGVCNSNGNCHCMAGWAPPVCTSVGNGGSIDSGPVFSPGYSGFVVVMFVFFLGVVPLVGIFSCLWTFRRKRGQSQLGITRGLARFIPRKQRAGKKKHQLQIKTSGKSAASDTVHTSNPDRAVPNGTVVPINGASSSASDRVASELSGAYVGFSLRPLKKPHTTPQPTESAQSSAQNTVEGSSRESAHGDNSGSVGGSGYSRPEHTESNVPRTTFTRGRPLASFDRPGHSPPNHNSGQTATGDSGALHSHRPSTARTTFRKRFPEAPAASLTSAQPTGSGAGGGESQQLSTSASGRTTFSSVRAAGSGGHGAADETVALDRTSNSTLSTNASISSSQIKSNSSKAAPVSTAAGHASVLHPRKSFKAGRVDRQRVRTLGISDPIPQSVPDIDAAPLSDSVAKLQRTRSHRATARRPPVPPPPCPPDGTADGHVYETLR